MRKLLLFAGLFLAGLLVLTWVEPPRDERESQPDGSFEEPGLAGPERAGLSLAGGVKSPVYDPETGRTVLYFESEDGRTTDQGDELLHVTLDLFDVDAAPGAPPPIRMSADSMLVPRAGVRDYQPVYESLAHLRRVKLDVTEGLPCVPLVFLTPAATVDARLARERRIVSDEVVEIRSERLTARGIGTTIEPDANAFEIERQGEVDLFRDGRRIGRLQSEGPIRVHRTTDTSADAFTLEARDAAELVLEEEETVQLGGDRIRIEGHTSADGQGLVLELVEALGEVRASSRESVFTGDRATVRFSPTGELLGAVLRGLPRARLSLRDQAQLLPEVPAGELERVLVWGEGPLEIGWGERRRFSMGGPAVLETPGVTLRSRGTIVGWVRASGDRAGFQARGGNVLETEAATLESPSLDLDIEALPGGGSRVLGRALEGPRLVGHLEDGREFRLTSPNLFEVRREGGRWRVDDADDVVFWVEGPKGFEARARRVEHFEPEPLSLVAHGAVRIQNSRGRCTGEHLEITLGEEPPENPAAERDLRYVIEGSEGAPARYVGYDGEIAARRVEGTGQKLRAEGSVAATLKPPTLSGLPQEYVLSCDVLEFGSSREAGEGGLDVDRYRFDAQGDVKARFASVDEESSVNCKTLLGVHEQIEKDDELVRATSRLIASGGVESRLVRDRATFELSSRELLLERTAEGGVASSQAVARGGVRFRTDSKPAETPAGQAPGLVLNGLGELLVLNGDGSGRLDPLEGERVLVHGLLPSHDVPFELDADDFTFSGGDRLVARNPRIELTNLALAGNSGDTRQGTVHATAKELLATGLSLELTGDTRIDALTARGVPWRLESQRARFEGRTSPKDGAAEVRSLKADGGVDFRLGIRGVPIDERFWARAVGDELVGHSLFGTLRLSGKPVRIDWPAFDTEVDWVEINPELQIIERMSGGRAAPRDGAGGGGAGDGGSAAGGQDRPAPFGSNRQVAPQEEEQGPPQGLLGGGPMSFLLTPGWEFQWSGCTAQFDADNLVLLFQEPRFRQIDTRSELRASWMVLWLDRRAWERLPEVLSNEEDLRELGKRLEALSQEPDEQPRTTRLFGMLRTSNFGGLLREIYFEGPVEILLEGALFAHADAVYLDAVAGHGWLAEATVNIFGRMVGQSFDKLIVKAHWLRHSADGSLQANDATVTPCDFDQPHLKIVTGDLQIRQVKTDEYAVSLKKNRVELYDTIKLPLPPLAISTDERARPLWETIRFGDSSRFGSFVSGGIVHPAGKVGEVLNDYLGGDPFDYDASYSINGSFLGSRGALLDLGMRLASKDSYWMVMHLGGVPDTGEDRGYIRVPEDERDTLRLWFRSHGRWDVGPGQTVDFSLSKMSDPGVQSEFFESDFERYERDETYVEWQRVDGAALTNVTAKPLLEDFRSDVAELPSVRSFRGRTSLATFGPASLIHTGDARFQLLRRHEGDPRFASPFGIRSFGDPVGPPGFGTLDGAGDRDVMRLDASERVELQTRLGAGVALTPFVGARFTAWDEGLDPDDSPTRLLAQAGARLSAALWKRGDGGRVHQVFPYVEAHGDFVDEFDGGDPLPIDSTEEDPRGRFLEVGTRARFAVEPDGGSALDLDVRSGYGFDLPESEPDSWLPLLVFARTDFDAFGMPIELWHDGRFDLEDRQTDYSLIAAAFRVSEDLRFEIDHRHGRSRLDESLYEAASLGALFHWTEKWEFEGHQTFSLKDNDRLDSSILLRRFGHDWIFELESSVRRGEGGASLSVSVRPLFGYDPSRLGYLRW